MHAMGKFLSLTLSASLVFTSVGPALAIETVTRPQTGISVVMPVLSVPTQITPGINSGIESLSTLPAINSVDAQAIDAAALLGPEPAALVPGAELTSPIQGSGAAPDLNAAVQAAAEEAQKDDGITAQAQLGQVETAALTGDKTSQDKAWSGLRDSVAGVPVLTSGPVSRFSSLRRAGAFAAKAGIVATVALQSNIALAATGPTVPAAPSGILHAAHHFVAQYAPLGISLASIYAAQRVVSWIVGKATAAHGGDEDAQKTAKLISSLATWGLGSLAVLHFGGAPAWVTDTAASMLPAGATIASQQLMGNALEASKVLMYHSFVIGDRIKIGDNIFRVADLSLTDVVLQNEMYPGKSPTPITYIQLAGKVITVLRPYVEPQHKLETPTAYRGKFQAAVAAIPGRAKEVGSLVWQTMRATKGKTWLWLAGGVGVAVGASFVVPLVSAGGFLATVLGIVKGVGIFTASTNLRRMVVDFLQRLGEKRGWHPQTTRVVKFFAEIVSYAVGGTWGLSAAGTTLGAFMKGGFTTGVAFIFVARDVLTSLLTYFRLKFQRVSSVKTFKIGNWIQTNGLVGKLVDMNMQYVVLAHDDGTHSLISYGILDATQATALTNEADIAVAKKKFPPPTAAPIETK